MPKRNYWLLVSHRRMNPVNIEHFIFDSIRCPHTSAGEKTSTQIWELCCVWVWLGLLRSHFTLMLRVSFVSDDFPEYSCNQCFIYFICWSASLLLFLSRRWTIFLLLYCIPPLTNILVIITIVYACINGCCVGKFCNSKYAQCSCLVGISFRFLSCPYLP